jgi:hypothetical protein
MVDEKAGGVHTVGVEEGDFHICIRCGDKVPTANSSLVEGSNYVWLTDKAGQGRKWEAVEPTAEQIDSIGLCQLRTDGA